MKTHRFLLAALLLTIGTSAHAQQDGAAQPAASAVDQQALANANNPLARVNAVNLHNYYIPTLSGTDQTANTTFIRYAQPIGRFLVRASLPFGTTPNPRTATGYDSGLGDFNVFAIYTFEKGGKEFGIGPQFVAPTATTPTGGAGKWQLGLSALVFMKSNPVLQGGGLLTWQTSIAGQKDRPTVNLLTAQPFLMWQLGKGTYLRSAGVWNFDLEHGAYNIPVGAGIGQVLKARAAIFNIFIEPQYSVLQYGIGQPKVQLFVGFNTQF